MSGDAVGIMGADGDQQWAHSFRWQGEGAMAGGPCRGWRHRVPLDSCGLYPGVCWHVIQAAFVGAKHRKRVCKRAFCLYVRAFPQARFNSLGFILTHPFPLKEKRVLVKNRVKLLDRANERIVKHLAQDVEVVGLSSVCPASFCFGMLSPTHTEMPAICLPLSASIEGMWFACVPI